MPDEPDDPVLLRRIAKQIVGLNDCLQRTEDRLQRVEGKVDLLTARVGSLEMRFSSLETRFSVIELACALQATNADRTFDRLENIERRLNRLEQAQT